MKKLVKGLRLNDDNRKLVARSIADSKLGNALKQADKDQRGATTHVQNALIADCVIEANRKTVLAIEGLMPTVEEIVLQQGSFETSRIAIPFSTEVLVPWAHFTPYGRGCISYEAMQILRADEEGFGNLLKQAEFYTGVKDQEANMLKKMVQYLRGFTSPQKLLDANPEFEQFLPEDMWEEKEATESVSISDILAA